MTTEAAAVSTTHVVQFFKVVADKTRLAIIDVLALTDLRAGEIVARLGLPQNAVSYHLKQLRAIGLLRDRRSNSDARDVYYSVDIERLHALYVAAGATLHARNPEDDQECGLDAVDRPLRILYLCTHNSARSQLAEGITRKLGGNRVEVYSAGSAPADIHPMTLEMLEEWNIDPMLHRSKSLNEFVGQPFDYVITVCDRVRDQCPTFPDDPKQIHWSFSDPTKVADRLQQRQAFETIRRELNTRIRYLLCLPHPVTGKRFDAPLRTASEQEST